MIREHGADVFAAIIERYLDATEARTRADISAIDDGIYRGSAVIDDDGINPGRTYEIHVEVRWAATSIELDFAAPGSPGASFECLRYDAAFRSALLSKDLPLTRSASPVTAKFPLVFSQS